MKNFTSKCLFCNNQEQNKFQTTLTNWDGYSEYTVLDCGYFEIKCLSCGTFGTTKEEFDNFIKHFCEDCSKELKDEKELKKHYNKNHTIRTIGTFSIIDKKDVNMGKKIMIKGIALTNTKAGDEVNILI